MASGTNSPPSKGGTAYRKPDGSWGSRPTTKADRKKVAKAQSKRRSVGRAKKRSTTLSRAKGASGKAYRSTRGKSSKRAVRRTAGKIMSRQLRKRGVASTRAATKKARQMVRARKARRRG